MAVQTVFRVTDILKRQRFPSEHVGLPEIMHGHQGLEGAASWRK